jgi:hypothetical protein
MAQEHKIKRFGKNGPRPPLQGWANAVSCPKRLMASNPLMLHALVERLFHKQGLPLAKAAIASAMLICWLLLLVLSASPEAHHAVHSDANSSGHHCLVTAFHKGAVESGLPIPVIFFALPVLFGFITIRELLLPPSLNGRLFSPRSPPFLIPA